jgi:hypothetical protein
MVEIQLLRLSQRKAEALKPLWVVRAVEQTVLCPIAQWFQELRVKGFLADRAFKGLHQVIGQAAVAAAPVVLVSQPLTTTVPRLMLGVVLVVLAYSIQLQAHRFAMPRVVLEAFTTLTVKMATAE